MKSVHATVYTHLLYNEYCQREKTRPRVVSVSGRECLLSFGLRACGLGTTLYHAHVCAARDYWTRRGKSVEAQIPRTSARDYFPRKLPAAGRAILNALRDFAPERGMSARRHREDVAGHFSRFPVFNPCKSPIHAPGSRFNNRLATPGSDLTFAICNHGGKGSEDLFDLQECKAEKENSNNMGKCSEVRFKRKKRTVCAMCYRLVPLRVGGSCKSVRVKRFVVWYQIPTESLASLHRRCFLSHCSRLELCSRFRKPFIISGRYAFWRFSLPRGKAKVFAHCYAFLCTLCVTCHSFMCYRVRIAFFSSYQLSRTYIIY